MTAKKTTEKAARAAMRDLLKTPTPTRSGRPSKIPAWFSANPEAFSFFETWLEMRAQDESDWSVSRIHRHLVEAHCYPFRSTNGIIKWARKHFGELYDAAVL